MTKQEFSTLYEKCNSGNCTKEEKAQLEAFQDPFRLSDEWNAAELGDKEAVGKEIYAKLRLSIKRSEPVKLQAWRWLAAACIALCVLSIGVYYYPEKPSNIASIAKTPAFTKEINIAPGSDKAILMLSDGRRVDLESAKDGLIASEGSAAIVKENGKIVYNQGTASGKNLINTIYIPRGGEYQLELPDGSKVWLNSESKLNFPSSFSGNERKVELQGEAYFEVAKDKSKPFRVIANGTEVKVLGTHFNLKAYTDEKLISTTLLEGSVAVNNAHQSKLLVPGQQSVCYQEKPEIDVAKVRTEEVIAWKSGYFIFDNQDIKSIMTIISRWYNVDVEYKLRSNEERFGGTFSRSVNMSEILKNLELLGTVHFTVKERRIIVSN